MSEPSWLDGDPFSQDEEDDFIIVDETYDTLEEKYDL